MNIHSHHQMINLGINMHSMLNWSRTTDDCVWMFRKICQTATEAGADSINVDLQAKDAFLLDSLTQHVQEYGHFLQFSIELQSIILDKIVPLKPAHICLVGQLDDRGNPNVVDVCRHFDIVQSRITQLKAMGIATTVMIDGSFSQIQASAKAGVSCVRIHLAAAEGRADVDDGLLQQLQEMQKESILCGLRMHVHAESEPLINAAAAIPGIETVYTGDPVFRRAVFDGLHQSVRHIKAGLIRSRLKGC